MSCHTDDCTLTFYAHCPMCRYDGSEHRSIRTAVADCTEHNRKHSHRTDVHGYAHVRAAHDHTVTTEAHSS